MTDPLCDSDSYRATKLQQIAIAVHGRFSRHANNNNRHITRRSTTSLRLSALFEIAGGRALASSTTSPARDPVAVYSIEGVRHAVNVKIIATDAISIYGNINIAIAKT